MEDLTIRQQALQARKKAVQVRIDAFGDLNKKNF